MANKYTKRPYTIIEEETLTNGSTHSDYFLVYGDKRLNLFPTEYAVLASLLGPKGLDLEEVNAERSTLKLRATPKDSASVEPMDPRTLSVYLCMLRKKVGEFFDDEIIIPEGSASASGIKGLRLWTREDLVSLRLKIAKPRKGVVMMQDEGLLWRLFVNQQEVRPRSKFPSYANCLLVRAAATSRGFSPRSPEFRAACGETGNRDKLSPEAINKRVRKLNTCLKQVGMILVAHAAERGAQQVYRLVPCVPATKQIAIQQRELVEV